MVTLSLIKEARIYSGEKTASSISGAVKNMKWQHHRMDGGIEAREAIQNQEERVRKEEEENKSKLEIRGSFQRISLEFSIEVGGLNTTKIIEQLILTLSLCCCLSLTVT